MDMAFLLKGMEMGLDGLVLLGVGLELDWMMGATSPAIWHTNRRLGIGWEKETTCLSRLWAAEGKRIDGEENHITNGKIFYEERVKPGIRGNGQGDVWHTS